MRILWVAGQWLEPEISGIYKYSYSILRLLRALGHQVDVICRDRWEGAPHSEPYTGLREIRRSRIPIGLAKGQPVKVACIDGPDFRRAVTERASRNDLDMVIIDHLRSMTAIESMPDDLPVLYLSQNNEQAVRRSSVEDEGSLLRRQALKADLALTIRAERSLVERASAVSTVSDIDLGLFGSLYQVSPDRLFTVPPVYSGSPIPSRSITSETPRSIVLATDLSWSLKVDNTRDILVHLAPAAASADVSIIVSGYGQDGSSLPGEFPDVEFVGFVDDLPALLAQSRIGLIHDPRGGGIKMKALDYSMNRLPIASLPGDLAGLPLVAGEDTIVGTTSEELSLACVEAIDDLELLNRIQQRSFDACLAVFGADAVADQLTRALDVAIVVESHTR